VVLRLRVGEGERVENRVKPGYLRIAAGLVAVIVVDGCSTSPAQNLFGSFFPAWMLSAATGIVSAVVMHQILRVSGINQYLIAPPLTYLCFAVAGTLLVWLLWFGH